MKATLERVEKTAKNTYTFWFSTPKKFSYIAGQFIELTLPHDKSDDRGERRWFTLSSSPTEPFISISTRFSQQSSSFKRTLKSLRSGDKVSISQPMGDFVLPKDRSIPIIFITAGIGATPVRSIIKYLADTKEVRDITLICSARSPDLIVFRDLFASYQHKHFELSGERLSASKILDIIDKSKPNYYYLSGPEPTVERLQKELINTGVNRNCIFTDFFHNYPDT